MEDEYEIIAVLIEQQKSIQATELQKFIVNSVPNSRVRSYHCDSLDYINTFNDIIVVARNAVDIYNFGKIIFDAYKLFVKGKGTNNKRNLMVQIKTKNGDFVQVNLDNDAIDENEFLLKFKKDIEIRIKKTGT